MLTPPELCRCLGDETRLQILLMLRQQGELCVCDLVDALALPQPTVSRHLARLRDCQLVADRREGQWIHYKLADDLPAWALAVIDALYPPARQHYRLSLQRAACC